MQHIKLTKNDQYFKIQTAMRQGDDIVVAAGTTKKQPPWLMEVTNLESGEYGQIIVPAILKSELDKQYAGDAYVGKCFALSILTPEESGKKYNLVNITEIEDPDAPEVEAPTKGAKAK